MKPDNTPRKLALTPSRDPLDDPRTQAIAVKLEQAIAICDLMSCAKEEATMNNPDALEIVAGAVRDMLQDVKDMVSHEGQALTA